MWRGNPSLAELKMRKVLHEEVREAEGTLTAITAQSYEMKIELIPSVASINGDTGNMNKPESGLQVDKWVLSTKMSSCTGRLLRRYSTASYGASGFPAALMCSVSHRADNPIANSIHTVVEIWRAGGNRNLPFATSHLVNSTTLPNDWKQVEFKNLGMILGSDEKALLLRLCGKDAGILFGKREWFAEESQCFPARNIPGIGSPGLTGAEIGTLYRRVNPATKGNLSLRYVSLRGPDPVSLFECTEVKIPGDIRFTPNIYEDRNQVHVVPL